MYQQVQQVLWSEARALGCSRSLGRTSRPFWEQPWASWEHLINASQRGVGSCLMHPCIFSPGVLWTNYIFQCLASIVIVVACSCNIVTNHTEEKNVLHRWKCLMCCIDENVWCATSMKMSDVLRRWKCLMRYIGEHIWHTYKYRIFYKRCWDPVSHTWYVELKRCRQRQNVVEPACGDWDRKLSEGKGTWKENERNKREKWRANERNMKRKMKGAWKENERNMKGKWKEHERNKRGKWREKERNIKGNEWALCGVLYIFWFSRNGRNRPQRSLPHMYVYIYIYM